MFLGIINTGRYSPVRRASEGSKYQPIIHGPLQECQQLMQQQKSLAHRNMSSSAQSPPLDISSSLPGRDTENLCHFESISSLNKFYADEFQLLRCM